MFTTSVSAELNKHSFKGESFVEESAVWKVKKNLLTKQLEEEKINRCDTN